MTGFSRSARRPSRFIMTILAATLAWAGVACDDESPEPTDTGSTDTGTDAGDMGTDGTEDMGADADAGGEDTGNDTGSDTGTDTGSDTGTEDLPGEPAEYRSVLASIQGELPSEADITSRDVERIIPVESPLEFKVFVRDDSTSSSELMVAIVEGETAPYTEVTLADEAVEFRNGLWILNTTLSPGQTLRVRTTDGDGHVAYSPGAINALPLDEAIIDEWEARLYDAEQIIESTEALVIAEDASWELDGSESFEGTYAITEGVLRFEVTDEGGDVVAYEEGPYYVDETYYYLNPFVHAEGESELEGTWTRTVTRVQVSGTTETVIDEYEQTLVFDEAEETWTETLEGTFEGTADVSMSRSGTYEIEINENYTEAIGDFLARTVTMEDGEELDEPYNVLFELHVVRVGNLLFDPYIRNSGEDG